MEPLVLQDHQDNAEMQDFQGPKDLPDPRDLLVSLVAKETEVSLDLQDLLVSRVPQDSQVHLDLLVTMDCLDHVDALELLVDQVHKVHLGLPEILDPLVQLV